LLDESFGLFLNWSIMVFFLELCFDKGLELFSYATLATNEFAPTLTFRDEVANFLNEGFLEFYFL